MDDLTIRVPTLFADTVSVLRMALAEQGYRVLTEIDVQATMQADHGGRMENFLILGACHPVLAHQAMEADRRVGLLMPCNVVVRTEADSTTHVEAVDPVLLLSNGVLRGQNRDILDAIGVEARACLTAALALTEKRCLAMQYR